MTEFSIRDARKEDCATLLALIRGLASYEKLLDQCVTTEEILEKSLFGPQPVAHAFIGMEIENGKSTPIAFALYFYNFSTFLGVKGIYLEDIFVLEPYRHKGYGSKLMHYLAQVAVKEKCGRFEWSVLDWNKPAIGFYEKIGAKVLPDWRICRLTGEPLKRLADQ